MNTRRTTVPDRILERVRLGELSDEETVLVLGRLEAEELGGGNDRTLRLLDPGLAASALVSARDAPEHFPPAVRYPSTLACFLYLTIICLFVIE